MDTDLLLLMFRVRTWAHESFGADLADLTALLWEDVGKWYVAAGGCRGEPGALAATAHLLASGLVLEDVLRQECYGPDLDGF